MTTKTGVSFGEVQARAVMLSPGPLGYAEMERRRKQQRHEDVTRLVDGTLEDSFPASDPPSWTAGVARPAPAKLVHARDISPIRRALQRVAALF